MPAYPGPRAAHPLRPSFRQVLLVAFLLIAGLLAAASLGGLFTLERLMAQSRSATDRALLVTSDARQLAERAIAMERSARQFIVLDDPALLRGYEQAAADGMHLVDDLLAHQLPPALGAQWKAAAQAIARQLDAPTKAQLHGREAALNAQFRQLDRLDAAIAEAVRHGNEALTAELQAQLESGRGSVGRQVAGAIGLAALLALGFGVWLTRPLKRLERAIVVLGENRLDEPVDVRGPSDLRLLGQRLEWLRLRLRELDEDKSRFLRHVSHELKTPLAALREGVALLEDEVAGPLTADQREISRILGTNALTLQQQIESLLRFNAAAFEARQLARERTDLRALLRELVAQQQLQWQARQLRVEVAGDAPAIDVDPGKLAAALGNLLSNAIRFSPPGSHIDIRLAGSPGRVVIDLGDEGPGVAPADRARIFKPFYRGEIQPEDAVRGTGIGLSIVREYVQAHGGRVDLLDLALPGAHFRIELPNADD